MTKKTGLFDVDFTLTTKELTASIKGEEVTRVRYKDMRQYLLSKFPEYQLNREVGIRWVRNDSIDEDGVHFQIEITKGVLNKDDIVSFDGNSGAYRIIKDLIKDGTSVDTLQLDEKGILIVDCVLDDFEGYMVQSSSINVIGNVVLEQKDTVSTMGNVTESERNDKTETSTEKGLLGKMKSWFS